MIRTMPPFIWRRPAGACGNECRGQRSLECVIMAAATKTRSLKPAENRFIDQVLRELRLHFKEWTSNYRNEHDLIAFAIYEGCAGTG